MPSKAMVTVLSPRGVMRTRYKYAYLFCIDRLTAENEGVTWARGWYTKAAKALQVRAALTAVAEPPE